MNSSYLLVSVRSARSLQQISLVLLTLALLLPRTASAEERALEAVPVLVANRQIITLRGPIAGYSANERATASTKRIDAVLEQEYLPSTSLEETPDGTRVLLGGKPAFLVTRVDIDANIGETTSVVAREAAKRLDSAIALRRQQETPRHVALSIASALGATLLYGLVVWLLVWLRGWAGRRASAAAASKARWLARGAGLFPTHWLPGVARSIVTLIVWVAGSVVTVGWLAFVLQRFPYTQPWGEHVQSTLLGIFGKIVLATVRALPGLVFAALIFLLARGITRAAALLFDRIEYGSLQVGWLSTDTVRPTRSIFGLLVFLFALAMAYPYLPGASTDAFKGLSVLVGLMVSVGGAGLVGQAANGLTLMYTRSLRSGDYVRIGEAEGTVVEVGMFATRLKTGLGAEVMLPSSIVMAATIENYSRALPGTRHVVHTMVTIGYSTPWRQVHALLTEAARRTPGLAAVPPPLVRQTALSDFFIEYRLAAYTPADHAGERAAVLSDLHAHIQDVFNEYGVQIMSPHYEADPAAPQVVPKQNWYALPATAPAVDAESGEAAGAPKYPSNKQQDSATSHAAPDSRA